MATDISDASRQEIEALVKKLENLCFEKGTAYINALDTMFAEKLGKTYNDDKDAREYFDKFNNGANSLGIGGEMIRKALEKPRDDWSSEKTNESIRSRLEGIGKWTQMQTIFPKFKGETYPQALERTLHYLDDYIQQHASKFDLDELVGVDKNLNIVRLTVKEIVECCEQAKALAETLARKPEREL